MKGLMTALAYLTAILFVLSWVSVPVTLILAIWGIVGNKVLLTSVVVALTTAVVTAIAAS